MFRIASAKLKGCVRIRPSEQEHILNKYAFYTFVLAKNNNQILQAYYEGYRSTTGQ